MEVVSSNHSFEGTSIISFVQKAIPSSVLTPMRHPHVFLKS